MRLIQLLMFSYLLLFQWSPQLMGQEIYSVNYHFEQDTLQVLGGKTFSNKLVIHNKTSSDIVLSQASNAILSKGLIQLPDTLILTAGEKRIFPLKYIADKHTIRQNLQDFTVSLQSNNTTLKVQPSASFFVQLGDVNGLLLDTEQPVYYLNQATNQTQLMLSCSNNGLVPISFRLILSEVPEGLEFTGEQMQLNLQPGSKQLLPFTARNRLSSRQIADFTVAIQAMDASGKQLAIKRIRIQSASSISSFFGSAPFGQTPNNTAAFRFLSLNQNNSIYQMQANGDLDFNNNHHLNYQLNLDYYQQLQGINMYDTYLSYQTDRWGLKAGNIYENLDYALGGRGTKATYHFNRTQGLSVYALQNNYMLASQIITGIPGENILAANYIFTKNEMEGRLTYLHSHQSYTGLNRHQMSSRIPIKVGTNQTLAIEAGYSQESFEDTAGVKHAFSSGLDYSYTKNGYQLSTNNYYSSPYFTGIRRGILQSDTRLLKTTENGKIFSARVNLLNNRPQFQGRRYGYGYIPFKNSIYIYELGYGTDLGAFHIDIKPYLMRQGLTNGRDPFQVGSDYEWTSTAARTQLNLNYSSSIHSFYIHADYGYTYKNNSDLPPAPFHSFRLNGSYTNPLFGFSAYMQLNPYYLSDAFAMSQDAAYRLYSFGPNTQFSAFKNKLQVQVSAMYSYYGFTNNHNYSVNGNARWILKGNWAITADAFYTLMQMRNPILREGDISYLNSYFNTTQIRVGIEKQFSSMTSSAGKRLRLLYYEDRNNNGMRDADEQFVNNIMVKIKDKTAFTDQHGQVEFQQMPVGNYSVELLSSKGWNTSQPLSIVLEKNKTIEVPLIRSKVLEGKLLIVGKSYQLTRPILSGIRIQAVDRQGKQHQTLTDVEGHYTFYLPPGSYQLSIETEGMPFSIENAQEKVQIKDSQERHTLNFKYRDERRKVGITRF